MTDKYAGFGTILKRGATPIASVGNIQGPGLKVDTEDVTSHDSTGGWEEVVATIIRSGEVSFDILYDPNDATHKNAATGLIADLIAKAPVTYSLLFPSTAVVTWTFSAIVTGFEPSAPVDGALTASVSLKLTGQPTLA